MYGPAYVCLVRESVHEFFVSLILQHSLTAHMVHAVHWVFTTLLGGFRAIFRKEWRVCEGGE